MAFTNRRFRTHVFTFSAAELEMHENLMPCVIFGNAAPVRVGNRELEVSSQIVAIKPGMPHTVSIAESGAEIVYFDGLQFRSSLPSFYEVEAQWLSLPNAIKNEDHSAIYDFRGWLGGAVLRADPDVLEIVEELYSSSMNRLSQLELSQRLGLERTQALRHFKANTGQTFRKFKIWASTIAAAHDIFHGKKIGVAGIDSGFSDAAHVARTARRIFGLTPTVGMEYLRDVISV